MVSTVTGPRALRAERVPATELVEGTIAGRGVRLPSGARLPLGTPLTLEAVRALASSGEQVEVLVGAAARPLSTTSPAAQMRAGLLQAVMRANLEIPDPAARAVERPAGERAVAALEMAVATVSWFAPAADIIIRHGLAPSFLGPAMSTALLAGITGAGLGWDDDVLADLALSALLADIGMLLIPAHLAAKPGRLSRLERREVQQHARLGAELLAPLASVAPLVPLAALQHHERVDGTGYPAGLSGAQIRPEAQVVAVCHRYLAAVAPRPHRPAMPPHEALETLMSEGGCLAAGPVIDAFMRGVAPYPVGEVVRLSDGRGGRVTRLGTPSRPVVEVLFDENGEPADPEAVDLARHPSLFVAAV